jgi:hypothetical protein
VEEESESDEEADDELIPDDQPIQQISVVT